MTVRSRVKGLPPVVKGVAVAVVLGVAVALIVWLAQPQKSSDGQVGATPSDGKPPPGAPESPVLKPPFVVRTPTKVAAVHCPTTGTKVSNAEELTTALGAAKPGTSIVLADGIYTGAFVASRSGTAAHPIWLCGGPGAVLDGGGIKQDAVLHLNGVAFWRVVGFTVRNGQKGVMADATARSVIEGLDVHDIGDEGIHLRATSTGNAVLNNKVYSTGLRKPKFGEGIYVGSAESNMRQYAPPDGPDRSDYNLIVGNTIHDTSAESIDIKEGTTGGLVRGNTFDGTGMSGGDSWVDVKGNEWLIENNKGTNSPADGFQTHEIIDGWGTRNLFRNNIVNGGVPGLGINLAPIRANVVACSNHNTDGSPVTTNSKCSG